MPAADTALNYDRSDMVMEAGERCAARPAEASKTQELNDPNNAAAPCGGFDGWPEFW